jgi:hypothetical protein
MDSDSFKFLEVIVYLLAGTAGVAGLAAWALKRFGSAPNNNPKNRDD